jgi:hypothetical protein
MSIERTALLLDEREFEAEYEEIKHMVIAGEPGAEYLRLASSKMFSVLQKTLDSFKREYGGDPVLAQASASKYGGAEATPVYMPIGRHGPTSDTSPIYEVPFWARNNSGPVATFSLDKDLPTPCEFYRVDANSLLMSPVNTTGVSILASDHDGDDVSVSARHSDDWSPPTLASVLAGAELVPAFSQLRPGRALTQDSADWSSTMATSGSFGWLGVCLFLPKEDKKISLIRCVSFPKTPTSKTSRCFTERFLFRLLPVFVWNSFLNVH